MDDAQVPSIKRLRMTYRRKLQQNTHIYKLKNKAEQYHNS